MTETVITSSSSRRLSARIRRRAPATLQIVHTSVPDWKMPIPLLSPLAKLTLDLTAVRSCINQRREEKEPDEKQKPTPKLAFNPWQHPAAPFGFGSAPLMALVCTAAVDGELAVCY